MRITKHCSSLSSGTFVMSRKIRIHVITLVSPVVGNKDSVMLLGLLADYSGKKKKNFRSWSYTLH